jgi:hypothetical protein
MEGSEMSHEAISSSSFSILSPILSPIPSPITFLYLSCLDLGMMPAALKAPASLSAFSEKGNL